MYKSVTHAGSLLCGLNSLRTHHSWTDLTLYSREGQPFHIHHLVLEALNLHSQLHLDSKQTVLYLDLSSAGLELLVTLLYTGQADFTIVEEETLDELIHMKLLYDITVLSNALTFFQQQNPDRDKSCKPTESVDTSKNTFKERNIPKDSEHDIKTNSGCKRKPSELEAEGGEVNDVKVQLKNFLSKKNKVEQPSNRISDDITTQADSDTSKSENSSLSQFCCYICGKIIAKKGYTAHMKVHANIKEKTCEVCGKRFRKACNLQEHWQRMHSVAKEFHCSRCGSSFALKSDLTRHIAKHKRTSFVCELCGASFVGKAQWKKHECMDDIFEQDELEVYSKSQSPDNMPDLQEEEEDILNISTLLPLQFTDETQNYGFLSEIDGLFYESQNKSKGK